VSTLIDPDLDAAAEEELGHAAGITWRELSRCMPWGDTYDGFTPGGRQVSFERAYVWAEHPGGDILCEVTAFTPERFEDGAKRTRLIRRDATPPAR
jgi:hypothetical protein